MFGKSGDAKKIKELEETLKKLRWDFANQKVEFNNMVKKHEDLTTTNALLQKEIKELNNVINKTGFNTIDVPNIPWVNEVITNPEGECFNCLPIHQKLNVWESVFNNIGFTSKFDIQKRYPFYFGQDELEEFPMTQLGLLYFSQLGYGYEGEETCSILVNLRDLKMISDEYPQMIKKIIHLVIPDATFKKYKEVYNQDDGHFTLTFEMDEKPIELIFEGSKYLDVRCIDQLFVHLKNHLEDSKYLYYFHDNFGYNICYINDYQKMMLEKIFGFKNFIKPLPNE